VSAHALEPDARSGRTVAGPSGVALAAVALAAVALAAVAVAISGCSLDVGRERFGVPLDADALTDLEVGRSDLDGALTALGAPHLIERENDAREDHLWWFHRDESDISIRFQVPLSVFGYRHNIFQFFQGDEQTNKLHLVFDDDGMLRQKDLVVPDAFAASAAERAPGRVHVAPRFEQSFFLSGSADFADYADLFDPGYVLGLDISYQPVAPLVLGIGGTYQIHEGDSLRAGGASFAFDDLEIFAAELMIRLQIPFEVFGHLSDFDAVRRILLDDNPQSADGWLAFVEGGAGVAYNEDVVVGTAGGRSNFFDSGVGLSNSATAGLEYSWAAISVRAGVGFRTVDALDEGNSGLDDRADSLRTWMGTLSVALKF